VARVLLLAAAAASLTACGGTGSAPPAAPPHSKLEQQWIESAGRFIATLEANLNLSAAGGGNLRTARRALSDESSLYTILVAYTYFGGCSHALANVGTPSRRLGHIVETLASACRRLQRASALFQQAVTSNDAGTLLAATRLVLATETLLFRAREELAAFPGSQAP
jgi:hypothetical protein